MAIDIGAEAILRGYSRPFTQTYINLEHPATSAGLITSIDIFNNVELTGLRVGTFIRTNGNRFKCHASQAIAGTIIAGSKVTKAVSIAVGIGDYIGCYFDTGNIYLAITGYAGLMWVNGEFIDPNDTTNYSLGIQDAISLGGYIGVAGWAGKISGVTNPAKIMGIDVANIKSVKGVE